MFRPRPRSGAALTPVVVEGRRVAVPEGASAAAAFLLAGFAGIRETPKGGSPRAPYCMMGACFECLAEIDGTPNRQSCMVEVRPDMRIRRQRGPREVFLRREPPSRGAPPERRAPRRVRALTVDLAIVGAGPAGMAAAALAAELGLDTLLIDEQKGPGGQIYRALERASPDGPLGGDTLAGRRLLSEFGESGALYRPATSVWHIDGEGTLYLAAEGRAEAVGARQILLATGAVERPFPIPGWTLPGVMTAGAAQILLKSCDIVPEGRSVLAGQGPLLYLLAIELARAGVAPRAILETTPFENYLAAAQYLGRLWPGRRLLFDGMRLLSALRRSGVPIRRAVMGLRAIGRQSLERVAWEGGEIAADHLFLHQGVIPNIVASRALALAHEWDEAALAWRPAIDAWGRTSHPAIAVAGDAAGIAGAEAAELMGRLAALDAAKRAGALATGERDRRAAPIRAALSRARAPRPFLDRLYRPPRKVLAPEEDDIILCRCEEVGVGEIRRAARLGASSANQLKAFTRCGMGPCQGRICGPLVSQILADALGRPVERVAGFRPRAPWKPIPLGALADLALGESGP